jgi:hypothetical protein
MKKYSKELNDLIYKLENLRKPNISNLSKERFKDTLKEELLFEFDRRNIKSESNLNPFRFVFRHALVTAVIMPFVILGGFTTYAYNSPYVYNGHILYPVKLLIEKAEYNLKDTVPKQAEIKLKLAERRLDEVEAIKKDTGELNKETVRQVAILTHSAITDISKIDDTDRMVLRKKIEEFTERQLATLSSMKEGTGSLSSAYLVYENNKSRRLEEQNDGEITNYKLQIIDEEDENTELFGMGTLEESDQEITNYKLQIIDEDLMMNEQNENTEEVQVERFGEITNYKLQIIDEDLMMNEQNENTEEVQVERFGEITNYKLQIIDEDLMMNEQNESTEEVQVERFGEITNYKLQIIDEDLMMNEQNENTEELQFERLGEEYLEKQKTMKHGDVHGRLLFGDQKGITQNILKDEENDYDSIAYLWEISNQVRNIDNSKKENVHYASNYEEPSRFYKPDIDFSIDLNNFLTETIDAYGVKTDEYNIDIENPFSFFIKSYFLDNFGVRVPKSIYEDNIEIYYTIDNSDPFVSKTKRQYKEGEPFFIDRSVSLKFVAVSGKSISKTYTLNFNYIFFIEEDWKPMEISQ